jgi:arylsulfatase A-like enzyme
MAKDSDGVRRNTTDGEPTDGEPESSAEKGFDEKVNRNYYPAPEYHFPHARIGLTYQDSKPDFPRPRSAPEGAPNVLLVLLDDIGYGVASAFGGLVETPVAERLAQRGLKYCQFHTTALCSPTRAALLTGRNHHTVASGVIAEMATGFPGYCGIIPKGCATIGELLKQNGYATSWFGKNHNVPDNQTSAAGPFDNWPTSQGFDYFYGFIGGETDQFYPTLVRNTEPVEPEKTPEEGYHFTTDITDECLAWMLEQKSIAPDRPFFAYFAPGAAHAPHQPPADWRGRHAGKFDMGWDEYRKAAYQRQLELGVIPKGTQLTARPEQIPAWDSYDAEHKRFFSRLFENFADYVEHTDYEVGRLIDGIEKMGELDNTLVIYIIGDNGSSGEGTLVGTLNEVMTLAGVQPKFEDMVGRIDEIGKPGTSPHYPVGWAWAGDTPFQWTKQIASHFGGTRNGMIVSWPGRIADNGGLRFQFHHSIDLVPTLLEVIGISQPAFVNGYPQQPIEGTSFAYTFDDATAASRHTVQYFEIIGNRALYSDGWIASCFHGRVPWEGLAPSRSFDTDVWELYNVAEDFSQAVDLAAKEPERLRKLQDMFTAEAAKHNVFPLDDRMSDRLDVALRPSYFTGRGNVTFYPGLKSIPEGSAPGTASVNHTITAVAELEPTSDGVLFCVGGDAAGWSLYVRDRRLIYHYNFYDTDRTTITSTDDLPTGKVELRSEYTMDEPSVRGGPATVKLFVNGAPAGEGKIPRQAVGRFGVDAMNVGCDMRAPVVKDYPRRHFPFNGKLHHVTLEFDGIGHQPTGMERLKDMIARD